LIERRCGVVPCSVASGLVPPAVLSTRDTAALAEFELRNAALVEIELITGERVEVRSTTYGRSLSYDTGGLSHRQVFEPKDGHTVGEVSEEIARAAEAAGWEVWHRRDVGWGGDRPARVG
jgi:hypothetical protein